MSDDNHEVSHSVLHAEIKVLQTRFDEHQKVEERDRAALNQRLRENGEAAQEANRKIDALTNQLKGANILFAGALAVGGVIIGWLASLGFGQR